MVFGMAVLLIAFLLPWWAVAIVCGAAALLLALLSRHIERSLPRRAIVGVESLPGATAVVVNRMTSSSYPSLSSLSSLYGADHPYVVRVRGETWGAFSDEPLAIGEKALVLDVEGNHLVVCQMPPELDLL